jgi:hypothetical protein
MLKNLGCSQSHQVLAVTLSYSQSTKDMAVTVPILVQGYQATTMLALPQSTKVSVSHLRRAWHLDSIEIAKKKSHIENCIKNQYRRRDFASFVFW